MKNVKNIHKNMSSHDSSSKLETPTDLSDKARLAITDSINPLIADTFALYVKTKNFHWHMSGSHYRDYHLMFDEQAGQILEMVDELAERSEKLVAQPFALLNILII